MALSEFKSWFFASSFFANKIKTIYAEKGKGTKLETVYQNIFGWCRETQKTLVYPIITNYNEDSTYKIKPNQKIRIEFSTPIKKDFEYMSYYIQYKEKDETFKGFSDYKAKEIEWDGSTMVLQYPDVKAQKFSIRFNWWGCRYPVISEQGVMLAAESVVRFKK